MYADVFRRQDMKRVQKEDVDKAIAVNPSSIAVNEKVLESVKEYIRGKKLEISVVVGRNVAQCEIQAWHEEDGNGNKGNK